MADRPGDGEPLSGSHFCDNTWRGDFAPTSLSLSAQVPSGQMDSRVSENPVNDVGTSNCADSDDASVDIEAALAAGTLTAEQAVVLLQKQLRRDTDARFAGLRARDGLVRSVVAHLTEAPTNWHQGLVYLASDAGTESTPWLPWMLLGAVLMVLTQSIAASGILVGTRHPGCLSSDHCAQSGTWCSLDYGRCEFCGQAPLIVQIDDNGALLNRPGDMSSGANNNEFNLTLVAEVCASPIDRMGSNVKNGDGTYNMLYTARTVTSWCETCVHAIDGKVDPLTAESLSAGFVDAMGFFVRLPAAPSITMPASI